MLPCCVLNIEVNYLKLVFKFPILTCTCYGMHFCPLSSCPYMLLYFKIKFFNNLLPPQITCMWLHSQFSISVLNLHETFLLNSCKIQTSCMLLTLLLICMIHSSQIPNFHFIHSLLVFMVLQCLQLFQERFSKRRVKAINVSNCTIVNKF